ncbi:TonB-dependent receptor [Marivirga atlantica]|jgi:hypothetical protein|uniref:TonB-dependent receptor n=1 Tax=Marivirga atlantica TaxID=1548457 RepID=A0A937DII8_9BACT|nr:TonB-dependent receptor [Marivirga atlantica]MBL0763834.1 TonB-dependent receptor [Marivirga atlantica]
MKKLNLFITSILLLTSLKVLSQTQISGVVKSQKGEALIGANIFIENTYDGASSDIEGNFKFATTESGQQTLIVSMIGFHPYQKQINCNGTTITINITLKEKIDQLNAVTISAGAMEASDMKKAVVMKPLDIVTTSGALGDIVGAFNKLPGTATVGNDGRLFVRGGDASETNIYFDGLQVGNAYGSTAQNVPTRSRFNPNLFKGSFFSTGGYSAEYGQALSSALVLNTIDMPLRNQTDISVMSIGGGITQTLVGERNAFTASANFMDLAPYMSIINQNMEFTNAPSNWNVEALGRQKIGKSGLLKAFVHTESASLAINRDDINETEKIHTTVDNTYHFGNVSFKNTINESWSYYGGASLSYNTDEISLENIALKKVNKLAHVKGVLVHDVSDRFSYKNGFETYQKHYSEEVINNEAVRAYNELTANHFVEADYYFSKKLVLRAGLRSSYNDLINKFWATPRASLAYQVNENGQFSLAYGQFKQLPKEELRVQQNNLENATASHYILNYLYSKKGRTFRGELFNKNYNQLVQYSNTDGFDYEGLRNSGEGYARGFDLFYRDNRSLKETDFWITYSFVDSKRNFKDFSSQVTPNYAPKHNASVVMKRFFQPLHSQLGFSYSWNSGYPFHNPNKAGEMQSMTKDYNNLSFSWSYLPKPNLIIHFECSNVLGSQNIFGYEYANQPNTSGIMNGRPISQVADRFIFLGVFLTLSKDKNANQLNNL